MQSACRTAAVLARALGDGSARLRSPILTDLGERLQRSEGGLDGTPVDPIYFILGRERLEYLAGEFEALGDGVGSA